MTQIIVKDSSGNVSAQFSGTQDQSIGTQAQDNGAEIPFSCGVGACRTCVCRVEKGQEFINKEAVGPMHISIEEDEILSCVAGIKADAPEDAEIVISAENL